MTEDLTPDRAEQAFRDALQGHADELEPVALDVRRHHRRLPVLAAAVAVLVLVGGVAATISSHTRSHADPEVATATSDGPLPVPDPGWRWVSWHDVAFQVPLGWGYGTEPGSDWCAGYDPAKPAPVQSPYVDIGAGQGATAAIGCLYESKAPAAFGPAPESLWAPHVAISTSVPDDPDPDPAHFDGWTISYRSVGDVQVRVTTDADTDDLSHRILDSARTFTTDQNGCEATSPVQAVRFVRPSPAFDISTLTHVDSVSVCLYSRSGTAAPGLLGSRRLDQDDSTTLVGAIVDAYQGGGPDTPQSCTHDTYGDTGLDVRLHVGDQTHDVYGYTDWCFGNGLDDGVTRHGLTHEDCRPLYAEAPVLQTSGSAKPFEACDTPAHGGAATPAP